eukprot:764357_1
MAVTVSHADSEIRKHEHLHLLNTMDPCGQSDIIDRYIEEAKYYETNTTLHDILDDDDTHREKWNVIRNNVIQILQGILNDGAIPLDVAFCRLSIILPYLQHHTMLSVDFIAFFVYFLVGSCFPSLRSNIQFNFEDSLFDQCMLLRYLVETYFPNLNDNQCIKFKYSGDKATQTIVSILEQHITSTTEYGDSCIASMICDYAQYPNHEFVYFINNFMWHFPSHSLWNRSIVGFIGFSSWIDRPEAVV